MSRGAKQHTTGTGHPRMGSRWENIMNFTNLEMKSTITLEEAVQSLVRAAGTVNAKKELGAPQGVVESYKRDFYTKTLVVEQLFGLRDGILSDEVADRLGYEYIEGYWGE